MSGLVSGFGVNKYPKEKKFMIITFYSLYAKTTKCLLVDNFQDFNLSYLNPNSDSGCKIVGFMATYIPKLKWACQS